MINQPTFAVVIPLHNKEKFIARALSSVFAQTTAPSEVIIVDDGSTDRSVPAAEEVIGNAENAWVLRQPNMGVSAARNAGARRASADFVAFLDADDEWLPNHLAVLGELARDFPDADVVVTRHCRIIKGERVRQRVDLDSGFRGIASDFVDTYRRGSGLIHSSSVAIRPEAFEACGAFPVGATRSQDIYLWLRLGLTRPIAFADVETVFRHEDGSAAPSRSAVVPYHLEKFCDRMNVPSYWSSPSLARYLRKSLLVFLAAAVHDRQWRLVRRLLAASFRLDWRLGVQASALVLVPSPVMRLGRRIQLYLRRQPAAGSLG